MVLKQKLKDRSFKNWLLSGVSLDHDGVVAATRQMVTEEFNRRHNTKHHALNLDHWTAVIDWGLEIGMSLEEANREDFDLWYTPKSLIQAEPVIGVIEFLKELENKKLKYLINSSRKPFLRKTTLEWYQNKIPIVSKSKIKTGLPNLEDTKFSKIKRIKNNKLHLHIDDVADHAKIILDNTDAYVILLSASENLDGYSTDRFIQIKGSNSEMPDFRPINEIFFG